MLLTYLKGALEEDVCANEEIEKILSRYGDVIPHDILLKSDLHAGRGLRMLQAMMDNEIEEEVKEKPHTL